MFQYRIHWGRVVHGIGPGTHLKTLIKENTMTIVCPEVSMYGFTSEELIDLEMVIRRSWDRLGGDIFLDDEGKIDYHKTFPRAHMVEIALDADRWRNVCVDKEDEIYIGGLVKKYYTLSIPEQECLLVFGTLAHNWGM